MNAKIELLYLVDSYLRNELKLRKISSWMIVDECSRPWCIEVFDYINSKENKVKARIEKYSSEFTLRLII